MNARVDGGTEQTRRKLQRRPLESLWSAGKLDDDHVRAAMEIERVFRAVTAAVTARVASYGVAHAPASEWRGGLIAAYAERYTPWRDCAGTMIVRHGYCLVDLVTDVVVEERGIVVVARKIGAKPSTVLKYLREGLWLYCEMAGWVRSPPRVNGVAARAVEIAA
jgi:hypothetical protein